MKCSRCGNDVGPEEAFCGQCGAPNMAPPKPTEVGSNPLSRSALPGAYTGNGPFAPAPSSAYNAPAQPAPGAPLTNRLPSPTSSLPPGQSQLTRSQNGSQQTGFYRDATEAMSPVSGTQGYQQQNIPGASIQGGYAGTGMQPFQAGNYASSLQSQQFLATGQGYGTRGIITPPLPKQSGSPVILIVAICVVVALISVIGIGSLYVMRLQKNTPQTPLAVASPVATTAPSPTPTTPPTPTPTPTIAPSPTVAPTPAPDAGFLWCAQECANYGFTTEYPATWQPGAATNAPGIQFTNPAQPDQYASFKTPGPTNSAAGDLVASDLQTNFADKPGFTPPTSASTATIGGETWAAAVAYYQLNGQRERVVVYATVHQGAAYIIELEAADAQFDTINTQFFASMLARYQFTQGTPMQTPTLTPVTTPTPTITPVSTATPAA